MQSILVPLLVILIPFCLVVFCSIFFTKQRWFYARRTNSFSYIMQHQDDLDKIAVTPKDKKTVINEVPTNELIEVREFIK